MTYKEWQSKCTSCTFKGKIFGWNTSFPLECPACGSNTDLDYDSPNQTHYITTDDLPGGYLVHHGLCNPDGSPKRYYSKTEIKRAANERGYTIAGDSPVPYKVSWSGKQKRIDGVKEH